jgi:hypothetical protein
MESEMQNRKTAAMLKVLSLALLAGIITTAMVHGTQAQPANTQVDTAKIKDGAVTRAKIAIRAVGKDQLDTDAVETVKIKNLAVTPDKLATDAVETAKIKNGAVSRDKLTPGAIGKDQLDTDAVETAKIKNGAVSRDKLTPGAIGKDQLDTDAVETAKIKNGAVSRDKLTVGAIGKDQLDTDAVETAKIKNGAVSGDKLAADAVDASKIKLGSITADRLAPDAKPKLGCLTTFVTPEGPMAFGTTGELVPSVELPNCIPAGPRGPTGPAGPSEVRAGVTTWLPGESAVSVDLHPAATKPFIAVVTVSEAPEGLAGSSPSTSPCVFLSAQTSETQLNSFEVALRRCSDGQEISTNKPFAFSWMIAPK